MRVVILAVVMILVSSMNAFSQPDPNLEMVGAGMYDGQGGFASYGNYLYYATRPYLNSEQTRLTIVDMSNNERPVRLGQFYDGETIYGLFLLDTLLFARELSSVMVYNVSNPVLPLMIGQFNDSLSYEPKRYNGLLTTLHGYSLVFMDISDIRNPQIVASISLPYAPADYDFYGNNVIFTNWANIIHLQRFFEIFDITDLQNPIRIDSTAVDLGTRSMMLKVAEDKIYLFSAFYGLRIYNISNPYQPEPLGTALEDFLFRDLEYRYGYLYASAERVDSLMIINISEPSNPIVETFTYCSGPQDILFSGENMYVSSVAGAASKFELSNPIQPQLLSVYVPGTIYIRHLVIGEYAYWASTDGFEIIDISDPSTPVALNEYYRYLAGQLSVALDDSLLIFDQYPDVAIYCLIDPRDPKPMGALTINAGANDISVLGNYMYIAFTTRFYNASLNGFIVADISDPANPIELGSYYYMQEFYDFSSIAVRGSYVYTHEESDSMGIYDVSDARHPSLVRRYMPQIKIGDIQFNDSIMYTCNWHTNQFYSLDMVDPTNPQVLDSVTVFRPWSFSLQGNIAFIADSIGAEVIDISNPNSLRLGASLKAQYARDIYARNDTVFLATLDSGLWVLYYDRQNGIGRIDDKPSKFILDEAYPNPFNSSTSIGYDLPKASSVTLAIYDILGRKVATLVDGHQAAGHHEVIWNAGTNSSGIYFARASSNNNSSTIKLIYLK